MESLHPAVLAWADLRDPRVPLWLLELLADVFFYAWLLAFGATVGSFLNVVIYRFPRGKNLAFPGSHCPHCSTPIRLTDNIPLLSWLALGGRCRDCRGTISPRYFYVELFVALLFVAVLMADYFLPPFAFGAAVRRPLTAYDGVGFWVMYAVHVSLATTLVATILIAADGFQVHARLFAPLFLFALLASLRWPEMRSIPAVRYPAWADWQSGLIDGLAGALVGGAIGVGLERIGRQRGRILSSLAPAPLAASLGVALGWQRVLWLAPLVLLGAAAFARGLYVLTERRRAAHAAAVAAPPPIELPLEATGPPTPDAIHEEIHIAAVPTESTEVF